MVRQGLEDRAPLCADVLVYGLGVGSVLVLLGAAVIYLQHVGNLHGAYSGSGTLGAFPKLSLLTGLWVGHCARWGRERDYGVSRRGV